MSFEDLERQLEAIAPIRKAEETYEAAHVAYRAKPGPDTKAAYRDAADALASARTEWKQAEEAAGRRSGGPGVATPDSVAVSSAVQKGV